VSGFEPGRVVLLYAYMQPVCFITINSFHPLTSVRSIRLFYHISGGKSTSSWRKTQNSCYIIAIYQFYGKGLIVNGEEWWSDFNLGYNVFSKEDHYPKYHYGFYQAAGRIWASLKEYQGGTIRTDKVRYVLTGHSRAAGVSNIISKWLIDEGVSKTNLYSYNFACPGVSIDRNTAFTPNKYSSIFNINCARDLVGQAPGTILSATTTSFWGSIYDDEVTQWGKYGRTYFWDRD